VCLPLHGTWFQGFEHGGDCCVILDQDQQWATTWVIKKKKKRNTHTHARTHTPKKRSELHGRADFTPGDVNGHGSSWSSTAMDVEDLKYHHSI
jgi:hypothetical protein